MAPHYRSLPSAAVVLGVAGLLPFAGFGYAAVTAATQERGLFAVQGLIAYGAIILSFLGAVHWGLALAAEDEDQPALRRLALGVTPALVGWVAMLTALSHLILPALAILVAGHVGAIVLEHRGGALHLVPSGYMRLRWVLSITVVLILVAVALLR